MQVSLFLVPVSLAWVQIDSSLNTTAAGRARHTLPESDLFLMKAFHRTSFLPAVYSEIIISEQTLTMTCMRKDRVVEMSRGNGMPVSKPLAFTGYHHGAGCLSPAMATRGGRAKDRSRLTQPWKGQHMELNSCSNPQWQGLGKATGGRGAGYPRGRWRG